MSDPSSIFDLSMAKWDKASGLKELEELIAWTERLRKDRRYSAEHTRWLARARTFLFDVFGPRSTYFQSLAALTWTFSGLVYADQDEIDAAHQRTYIKEL